MIFESKCEFQMYLYLTVRYDSSVLDLDSLLPFIHNYPVSMSLSG